MKYYWIASTIEIKMAVLPCREINTNKLCCYVSFADFKAFYSTFIDFLCNFIDSFYWFLSHFIDSFIDF